MTSPPSAEALVGAMRSGDRFALAKVLSRIEANDDTVTGAFDATGPDYLGHTLGVTGPPGSGKSTLVSAMVGRLAGNGYKVGVLAVDPSSPRTGGALLGDRIRMMSHIDNPSVFIRSLANRGALGGLSQAVAPSILALAEAGYERVLVETVGVGQAEVDIVEHADTVVVVVTPGTGDDVQASKAGILEIADILVVNKMDVDGSASAARHLSTMLSLSRRGRVGWTVPVLLTQADTGEGVEELLAGVADHRQYLVESGTLKASREARRAHIFRTLATARLAAALETMLRSPLGEQLLEQVASRRLSPRQAADRAVSELVSEPHRV